MWLGAGGIVGVAERVAWTGGGIVVVGDGTAWTGGTGGRAGWRGDAQPGTAKAR